jgi:hypothetical protein
MTHPAVRAVALVAALLWAWTVSAGQVHRLLVDHVVCDTHEQSVEQHRAAGPSADASSGAGPTWHAAPAHGDHDHGCATASLAPSEPPPLVALRAVSRLSWATVDPLAVAEAPRGPPLDFAPKTSPPAA